MHQLLSAFAFAWGWTDYRYAPGATLHTILPDDFPDYDGAGALKPDITSVGTHEYFEMKPVTNAQDAGKLADLQEQVGEYDTALQPLGYNRGESSAVTLGLDRMVLGTVKYQQEKYLVELSPAKAILFDGSDGRGILWYELTKLEKKREREIENQQPIEIPQILNIPINVQNDIDVFDYKFGEPGLRHDHVSTGLGIATLVAFRLTYMAYISSTTAATTIVTTNMIAGSIGTHVSVASINSTMSAGAA